MTLTQFKLQQRFIDFETHVNVTGNTQHGKTYGVVSSLSKVKEGVLFFNYKRIKKDYLNGWMDADKDNTVDQIVRALAKGRKINYMSAEMPSHKRQEAAFLIDQLFRANNRGELPNVIIAMDEVPQLAQKDKDTIEQLERLASTGLEPGLKAVFIGQRFASIPNNIFTQCDTKIMFTPDMEEQYFRAKGLPYDDIINRLKVDKYAYVEWSGGEIKGPYKI